MPSKPAIPIAHHHRRGERRERDGDHSTLLPEKIQQQPLLHHSLCRTPSEMKPFEDIPMFCVNAPSGRKVPVESNPYGMYRVFHDSAGPIYRFAVLNARGEEVESAWINDVEAARRILLDTKFFPKGPQTFAPFLSLVPMHLIGLEGEVHARMRSSAQRALAGAVEDETRLPAIATRVANRLADVLEGVASRGVAHWSCSAPPLGGRAVVREVDKMIRAAALDIVSGALFGTSWGAVEDYNSGKPFALAKIMHELHWRVADFNDVEWKSNNRHNVEELQDVIDAWIEDEIDAKLASRSSPSRMTMLDSFLEDLRVGRLDSREQVRNLCWTFLTMGHENVATALAWCLILLAENSNVQDEIREEILHGNGSKILLLTRAFDEAVRLYPSVPALTRLASENCEVMGYEIPRGTELIVNIYLLNRGEAAFSPNPNDFTPSRCPVISTRGPPDAVPFGVGDRSCIGRPLSYLELEHLLGTLIKRFKFVSANPSKKTGANNFVSLRPGKHEIHFIPIGSEFVRGKL